MFLTFYEFIIISKLILKININFKPSIIKQEQNFKMIRKQMLDKDWLGYVRLITGFRSG